METLKKNQNTACYRVHTLVLGSGAAGLNSAVQLHKQGIEDILIVTEGLQMGTSINTGSDKQTYYKMGMYGAEKDSPEAVARSLFDGGSMHADLALVEASQSIRAFSHLVNIGVPFPRDRYGQFVGYKTDHDPLQRGTSLGPYTSRRMCEFLIQEVRRCGIPVREKRTAVKLLTTEEAEGHRACGLIALNEDGREEPRWEIYLADNLVFAVGGPGGIYKTSVYPEVHTGAIGLALLAGANARNLADSQFGMASIKFRWNVSGTYMQVMPRFISTAADGISDEQEFLLPWFSDAGAMNSAVFLKGYQWPFDTRKVINGSSIIDILVYQETVIKGRRVFLDYRHNSHDFSWDNLTEEAYSYLQKSNALFGTPIERLATMNQPAIDLYADHCIDLTREPLEIAVCAQHNNGGLAGSLWWESENIRHLFPVGEVNGSHGAYRPGGSALTSGQAAGFRAAEYIANAYKETTLNEANARQTAENDLQELWNFLDASSRAERDWRSHREEFQTRMSTSGAHIRKSQSLQKASQEAWRQWEDLKQRGNRFADDDIGETREALRNLQLCYTHAVYLDAIRKAVESGLGSRGSALALSPKGTKIHQRMDDDWRFSPENQDFRQFVLESFAGEDGMFKHHWVERREFPTFDAWFENAWAAYRQGEIYQPSP